jgi:hypothetical protein
MSGLKYRQKHCYLSDCCLIVHSISSNACFLATVALNTELREGQVTRKRSSLVWQRPTLSMRRMASSFQLPRM